MKLYPFLLLPFLAFFALSSLRMLHMFQLNSYRISTQWRWLVKNRRTTQFPLRFLLAADCICIISAQSIVFPILLMCMYVAVALLSIPKKAKKPLVFTRRAVRLLCFMALLLALAFLPWMLTRDVRVFYVTIALCTLLQTLWIFPAALLAMPLEAAVRRYYVNDAKRILREDSALLTIGVTGSYGKTSVKHLLSTLLSAQYDTLMTPESYNTPMGVVLTVRTKLRPQHKIFVCEMGARRVGDIRELCDIVSPKFGVVTSIGPQHLETFGSLENVRKTKFELIDALPDDGVAFLNFEDENIRLAAANYHGKKITYGLNPSCDYYATDITASSRGTHFTAHTPKGEAFECSARLVGRHNVLNLIGAIAVCCELGIEPKALRAQAQHIESVPHRLQLRSGNGVSVIDDAYNSNPAGARAAIDALALFDGYKILVTPGMVELGAQQEALNREFGAYAAKVCDEIILVGEKPAVPIAEGVRAAGFDEAHLHIARDLQSALSVAYGCETGGRERVILLENDLPDNY